MWNLFTDLELTCSLKSIESFKLFSDLFVIVIWRTWFFITVILHHPRPFHWTFKIRAWACHLYPTSSWILTHLTRKSTIIGATRTLSVNCSDINLFVVKADVSFLVHDSHGVEKTSAHTSNNYKSHHSRAMHLKWGVINAHRVGTCDSGDGKALLTNSVPNQQELMIGDVRSYVMWVHWIPVLWSANKTGDWWQAWHYKTARLGALQWLCNQTDELCSHETGLLWPACRPLDSWMMGDTDPYSSIYPCLKVMKPMLCIPNALCKSIAKRAFMAGEVSYSSISWSIVSMERWVLEVLLWAHRRNPVCFVGGKGYHDPRS